jgi:hypothetical protein
MRAVCEDVREEGGEIGEGVGERVAEIDDVSVIVEAIFEGKAKVGLLAGFLFDLIALSVNYFGAVPDPSYLPFFGLDH